MYKFVDNSQADANFEGFAYQGQFGIEKVSIMDHQVNIQDSEGGEADVSYEDIPKLILALQAAYEYKAKGNK